MELKILTHQEFEVYLPSLNELFSLAFDRDLHSSFLEWRYLKNPSNELLVAVAIENNKVVANYSASTVLMKYNNEIHKTAISMTTMTHPEYNGRGLFTSLAELLYEEMSRRSYSFIWGFPNDNSHGVFLKKLQWENIYEIPTFTKKINIPLDLNVDDNYVFSFDNNFNNFIEQKHTQDKYHVFKDKEYYKWRYLNNPVNKYYNIIIKENGTMIGNLIYKEYKQSIDIIEINGNNDYAKQQLVIYLIKELGNNDFETVNSWISMYDPLHLFFERIGFTNTVPITYFGGRKLNKYNSMMSYQNWHIQMGDSDVY